MITPLHFLIILIYWGSKGTGLLNQGVGSFALRLSGGALSRFSFIRFPVFLLLLSGQGLRFFEFHGHLLSALPLATFIVYYKCPYNPIGIMNIRVLICA